MKQPAPVATKFPGKTVQSGRSSARLVYAKASTGFASQKTSVRRENNVLRRCLCNGMRTVCTLPSVRIREMDWEGCLPCVKVFLGNHRAASWRFEAIWENYYGDSSAPFTQTVGHILA